MPGDFSEHDAATHCHQLEARVIALEARALYLETLCDVLLKIHTNESRAMDLARGGDACGTLLARYYDPDQPRDY